MENKTCSKPPSSNYSYNPLRWDRFPLAKRRTKKLQIPCGSPWISRWFSWPFMTIWSSDRTPTGVCKCPCWGSLNITFKYTCLRYFEIRFPIFLGDVFFEFGHWQSPPVPAKQLRNSLKTVLVTPAHERSCSESALGEIGEVTDRTTRPGKPTKSYWKWPFIVDFPMKNGGSVHSYVI